MKLNNNALQELYDTIVNGTITISPHKESPIDKAFRECDEKLQKDIDFWKCGNEILHSANMDLVNYKQKLEKEIEGLKEHVLENHKIIADISYERDALAKERDDLLSRTHNAEDEVEELKETLEKANTDRTELQNDRDFYHGLYTELRKDYDKLFEENKQIKKELHTAEEARNNLRAELEAKVKRMDEITKDLVDAKVRLHFLKHSGNDWRDRAKHAEEEVEELKEELKESQKDYDELTSQYQKLTIENKKLQDGLRDIGYEQGQTDLWDMLQNVNDSQPYDFDAECDGMEDVISMDLEDFLDAYNKWKEEKETDRMRKWLHDFCYERYCGGCPLESSEYKCVCPYSFVGTNLIPDKDIKEYYEKARRGDADCMKETRKRVKEACDAFAEGLKAGLASEVKEVPVSCDIPIKDLASWECTIEATVEINKDLLEKVCGVKPEEEEHKLEYGDAVRLPWRDYDYMYIGPDEEEETIVHMFDPKNHAIATSHIGNVRYSGCKIILTNEEDLRKIWKYKK